MNQRNNLLVEYQRCLQGPSKGGEMENVGRIWNLLMQVFSEALDWGLSNWIVGLAIIALLVLWAGGLKKQK